MRFHQVRLIHQQSCGASPRPCLYRRTVGSLHPSRFPLPGLTETTFVVHVLAAHLERLSGGGGEATGAGRSLLI